MQGLSEFISTDKKVEYINQLLKVGFDTIDFGSFVSNEGNAIYIFSYDTGAPVLAPPAVTPLCT